MTPLEAIRNRHSVRSYSEQPIDAETEKALQEVIADCNKESGLSIQLVTNEPAAFSSFLARYGKFRGVRNYVSLIGKNDADLDSKIGYYGEKIVIAAQALGLNTCWVAMTYSKRKSKCVIKKDEKLVCTLSIGYGVTQGVAHKCKPLEKLCKAGGEMPDWFRRGMDAAMLAPTAMNQQKFLITLNGDSVKAEPTGGFNSNVDIGIIKYHFEVGAGKENFKWQ